MPPASKPRRRADPLRTYNDKRDFTLTAEPRGAVGRGTKKAAKRASSALSFVVQKHDATRLHYDFRLEHEGVLWSWAVPKGPSLDPTVRRLAARTEDHPLDYAGFEGVIPDGEYGGGPVIVWDRGSWTPEGDAAAGMAKGHLKFALKGKKLNGTFHLVRLKPRGNEKESWLLFKVDDEDARAGSDVVEEQPESVKSGKTIEAVAEKPSRVWHSDREKKARAPTKKAATKASPASDIAAAVGALDVGVSFTNLDKVLYPEANVTKAHLIAFYASVAERLLSHAGERPLMIVRCPDGHAKQCFFQKHATSAVPEVVKRLKLRETKTIETSMFVDDAAGLIALGQMGVLEVHTWMCHVDRPEAPDQLVLDIDPDEKLPFDRVIETAVLLRDRLAKLDLVSFVKTTGGKGLHVVVPLSRGHDWDTHKRFAESFVTRMVDEWPDRYVVNIRKDLRKGKLLLDYLRNGRGATAVAAYSPRARPGALVATPVSWAEVEKGIDPKSFTFDAVLERLKKPDPWKDLPKVKQKLTKKLLAAVG